MKWRSEVMKLGFACQSQEAFLQEERRTKAALLQRVLKYLEFDQAPLIQRNLRASSQLCKAFFSPRDLHEEETTNDRAVDPSESDSAVDVTERVGCGDTLRVSLSQAVLTEDIRAALQGTVYDDETERKNCEEKIQARLLCVKSQIIKYIRGDKLNSKGAFPSESAPIFDLSSEKSSSKEESMEDFSLQSGDSNPTLLLTKSQTSEQRQVSILSLSQCGHTEEKPDFFTLSPIAKPAEGDKSFDLSLSSSAIATAREASSLSRRSQSLIVSPRDEELNALFIPSSPPCDSNRPITTRVESVEVEFEPSPRVPATPKRTPTSRWRRWLCGCLTAN